MNSISIREKMLLGALLLTLMVASYYFLHLKPLQKDLLVVEDQLKIKQKKLNGIKPVRIAPGASLAELKDRKIQLQEQLEKEGKTLEGYRQSFIDLTVNDSIATLSGQITRLAVQNRLQVLEKHEEQQGLDTLTGTRTTIQDQEIRRPLFVLKLLGNDFYSLNDFISQLGELSYSVVITRLSISTDRAPGGSHYMIRASMTLAL